MREIKFRGYNRNTECFVYGSSKFSCTVVERHEYTLSDFWKLIETGAFEYAGQYTGLKDKNGVEIYEGDTVKLTNPKYQIQKKVLIGEVIFSYASFGVDIKRVDEWTNYTEGVEPSQTIYFLTISGSNNIEVIGNIYENKGLVVNE